MDMRAGLVSGKDYADIAGSNMQDTVKNNISRLDRDNATDEEMMKACNEFEQYMVEQVYKAMENTIMKADEEENEYESYFGDLRVQEYAKAVTEQGNIGLARQLYNSMKNNQGVKIVTDQAD